MTSAPNPAPRKSRVGSHPRGLLYPFPASEGVLTYTHWLIRALASTVKPAYDFPRASVTGGAKETGAPRRPARRAAAEPRPQVHRAFGVTDTLVGVGGEEPGVPRAQEREAELEAPAGLLAAAEVADGVAGAGVEQRDGARDPALADGRVGVAQREVVDVLAELPLELAALSAAEEVRLLQPQEAADPGALPQRG